MEENTILHGDALEELEEMPENSVHAVVTDPPYGLAFMGRDWDDFEPKEYQEWCNEWASEALRVLKPGGHLLAFSGNRTHHRLFTGVEDAGFEIRDTVTWHYGSGFPKALDVSKAIDKAAGAEREIIRKHPKPAANKEGGNSLNMSKQGMPDSSNITAPATDAADKWDGFKTCLKPATEFVVVARKPFNGTVAENIQRHGTGALNIDQTRIGNEVREFKTTSQRGGHVNGDNSRKQQQQEGRYPSNVVFGESVAQHLDRENGVSDSRDPGMRESSVGFGQGNVYGEGELSDRHNGEYGDSGGPSRYFYTSKASKSERTLNGKIENKHPTVKPRDLMEWLVKMVTAEGQTVLDPFAGSGTTLKAAQVLKRNYIGIEMQEKWVDVAKARLGKTPDNPGELLEEEQQSLKTTAQN